MSVLLNMDPGAPPVVVTASEGDVGRIFTFQLIKDGMPCSYPSATVTAEILKADGHGTSIPCTWSGSEVVMVTTEQSTIRAGKANCELRIVSDSYNLGTANFILAVEPRPINADTDQTDSSYSQTGDAGDVWTLGSNGTPSWAPSGLDATTATAGQAPIADGAGGWAWGRPPVDQEYVDNWLDRHPEATTTVEDGSLTEAKFTESLKLKSIKEYFTPEMFGAAGDGVSDDISYIETMLNSVPDNAECVFYKNYYISRGISVSRPVNIMMYGTFKVAPESEYCVRISGHDVRRNRFRLNLAVDSTVESQWDGSKNTIGLDCYATWENEFDVNINGFAVGVRLISTNIDCTYNKFFIRRIYNCKRAIMLTGDDTLSGGTTAQNTFIGGRIGVQASTRGYLDADDTTDTYRALTSILVGSRSNNNNNFLSVSFEGFGTGTSPYENRAIINANMNYCTFIGCRFEGITQFYSQLTCAVISGFGYDQIPNILGSGSSVGTYKARIAAYAAPVQLIRGANKSGDILQVLNNSDSILFNIDKDEYIYGRSLKLSSTDALAVNTSTRTGLKCSAKTLSEVLSTIGMREWVFGTVHGFIAKRGSSAATSVFFPVLTDYPASGQEVTGMMVFKNGKPQWYDGTQWVYADGTPVPTT